MHRFLLIAFVLGLIVGDPAIAAPGPALSKGHLTQIKAFTPSFIAPGYLPNSMTGPKIEIEPDGPYASCTLTYQRPSAYGEPGNVQYLQIRISKGGFGGLEAIMSKKIYNKPLNRNIVLEYLNAPDPLFVTTPFKYGNLFYSVHSESDKSAGIGYLPESEMIKVIQSLKAIK